MNAVTVWVALCYARRHLDDAIARVFVHGGQGVETFGVANATAMEAARTLDALGVEVVFRYPDVE